MPPRDLPAVAGDALEVHLVGIDLLRCDPRNARRHSPKNLAAIRGSLTEFGQRRPLVISPDYTVIAGNGNLQVMRELGWQQVWVTVFPGTAAEARAFGVADNRTGELAEWDSDLLRAALSDLPDHLAAAAGFDLADLAAALQDNRVIRDSADFASRQDEDRYTEQYGVIIPVDTENDQMSLLARLTGEGYHCKAITT